MVIIVWGKNEHSLLLFAGFPTQSISPNPKSDILSRFSSFGSRPDHLFLPQGDSPAGDKGFGISPFPFLRCRLNFGKMPETKTKSPHPGFQERFVRSNVDVAFGGGVLGPQPLDSHVLTPWGWKPFSDIAAGDIVCGINNTIQTVTHCTPHGRKECIRIILEDGSSAESSLDHKWWVMKDGQEMTAISFELLEGFQNAQRYGYPYDVYVFRCPDGNPVPVRVREVRETGSKEVACIGVSNDDQLYITDDFLVTKNCGKAQPLDALVLAPDGWKRMGDLKAGDIICNTHGSAQYVVQVYDKGERDVYKIRFDFGEVEACAEHLFLVWHNGRVETMTVGQMLAEDFTKISVRCPGPVLLNGSGPLPMDAYLLGRCLSKGHIGSKQLSREMRKALKGLGIDKEFFIPKEYAMGTVSQRKALLRGYMDGKAKGFRPGGAAVRDIAVPKTIAQDIADLVSSLGGCPTIKREYDTNYLMRIAMPNMDEYYSPNLPQAGICQAKVYRPIRGIEFSRKTQTRCIFVSDENHLYVTDHFVATHNTYAAILMVAEPSLDPRFRAVFTRRNLANLKAGGGIVDDFTDAYGDYITVKTSENPRIQFPSGAFVDCNHIADETPDKLLERIKGWQYDLAYMDELTSYEFTTFSMLGSRIRGKAAWTGKMRGTTNPKRSHWTRKMLDWYIGFDGFILPERDGVVRYYYQLDKTVEDIVFGASKEEVYELCKQKIDQQLARLGGSEWDYRNMIKSFVFYSGKMSENKTSIANNPNYVGSVAAVGGARSQQLIEGNFNVDEDDDEKQLISSHSAQAVFTNDEARNGDHWITVDLADVGSDNVVALYWDGFHIDDAMILTSSTPKMNYERIQLFAKRHDVPDSRIIYDAIHASYMYDYMPEAQPFISSGSTIGVMALQADRLKDECYLRLIDVINRGEFSCSEHVAKMRYIHKGISKEYSFQTEFLEECAVIQMNETPRGKKKLMTKKEMNKALGKGRSMDVVDPCAMRMMPVLRFAYGEELDATSFATRTKETSSNATVDVFDDTFWC